MVVGFYFEGPGGNPPQQEYGISRSALKKILSSKQADRLISRGITYDPDMALQDAISFLPDYKVWDWVVPQFWGKQQLLASNARPGFQHDPASTFATARISQPARPWFIRGPEII
jgi:hypothetical protein